MDLASGDVRITTIGVARPGSSRALALVRAVAGHPLLASLAFLAGVIATGVAWLPAATIYVIVVGGTLAGAGVIVRCCEETAAPPQASSSGRAENAHSQT